MNKFCVSCGAALEEGSRFCGSCGQPVTAPAGGQPAQTSAAQTVVAEANAAPSVPLAKAHDAGSSSRTWRIIGKFALLIVLFGLFQPIVSCENSFEIASMKYEWGDSSALLIAVYGTLICCLAGLFMLVPLFQKKDVPIALDWIVLAGAIAGSTALLPGAREILDNITGIGNSVDSFFGFAGEFDHTTHLGYGAYTIIIGLAASLLSLIIATISLAPLGFWRVLGIIVLAGLVVADIGGIATQSAEITYQIVKISLVGSLGLCGIIGLFVPAILYFEYKKRRVS